MGSTLLSRLDPVGSTQISRLDLVGLHRGGHRNGRSFADAVNGKTPPPPPPPVLNLKNSKSMCISLNRSSILAETLSFDHLETIKDYLPSMITCDHELKYFGGMRIMILFNCSIEAKAFLEKKEIWKEWFKWVIPGDGDEPEFERFTWIKILGLPIKLWDENNFSTIACRFGKVVAPFGEISTRTDYSFGRVGILTRSVTRINNEIIISAEGKITRIGIVEEIGDVCPFKPSMAYNDVEDDDNSDEGSDDDDKETEVADTWEENMIEEGEILVPENMGGNSGDRNFGKEGEEPNGQEINGINVTGNMEINQGERNYDLGNNNAESSNNINQREDILIVEASNTNNYARACVDAEQMEQIQVDPTFVIHDGPINLSPGKSNSFGPNVTCTPAGPRQNFRDGFCNSPDMGLSSKKRKRIYTSATVSQIRPPPKFDLNCEAMATASSSSNVEGSNSVSSGCEIEKTVEVGIEVGFEIDASNGILRTVLENKGEIVGNQ